MKKNEIRFISTENGINCEGNVTLSPADRKAVDAAFETLKKHFPNSGFCIVGINPEDERVAMVGNIKRDMAALMLLTTKQNRS